MFQHTRFISWWLLLSGVLSTSISNAHGPLPVSLKGVPIPPVPGLLDGPDPIVVNSKAAIALGKALFWDMAVGSDGVACASCHFHAGADIRFSNQLNPNQKSPQTSGQHFSKMASGGTGGANYTLTKRDFPLHQFTDPFNKFSGVVFDSDDVVSSAGAFKADFKQVVRNGSADDNCTRANDMVFHAGNHNTRQVEPRNSPSVINAVFYHRNFWDGRANNIFNGSNNWGDRDPNAGVWVKLSEQQVSKQRLHLINASLASQAVAPPLNEVEMSCQGRTFPALGRKLLARRPLALQKVHPEDSVLGSLSIQGQRGLNTTYRTLITQAFNAKYWSYPFLGPFGSVAGQLPYNQMEANFALFFGLSLQLYESTLVSDDAPFDNAARDANLRPIGLSATEQRGFNLFEEFHCNICHTGPALTSAAIDTNASLIAANPTALGPGTAAQAGGISRNIINHDATLDGVNRFMDFGFFNTGVVDVTGDPGLAGVDVFGNPLAFTDQYLAYLAGNTVKIVDKTIGIAQVRSCDFLKPVARSFAPSDSRIGSANYFNSDDTTLLPDPNGNQNCANLLYKANAAFVPSPQAAAQALADPNTRKMAKATQGAFKTPTLRNIELTGPYMHNGGLATLEQVIEFYSRGGNFESNFKHALLFQAPTLQFDAGARADLIAFLRSLTDDRVRYERAPFDHPELLLTHGQDAQGKENWLHLPATGAKGTATPLQTFDTYLPP